MREEVHAQSSGFALYLSTRNFADHGGHHCPVLIIALAPGSHNPSHAARAKILAASQNCLFFDHQNRCKVEDRTIKESIRPQNHAVIGRKNLGHFTHGPLTLFSDAFGKLAPMGSKASRYKSLRKHLRAMICCCDVPSRRWAIQWA